MGFFVFQHIPAGTCGDFTNPLWFREGEAGATSPNSAKTELLWGRQGSVGAAGGRAPHVSVSGWKVLSGSQSLCLGLCAETLNPQSFALCTLRTDNL